MKRFALRFGLEGALTQDLKYLSEKATAIGKHLIKNPEQRGPNGTNLTYEVIDHIVSEVAGEVSLSSSEDKLSELRNCLAQDGYVIDDGSLKPKLLIKS